MTILTGLFSRLCLSCEAPSGSVGLCPSCAEDPSWKSPVRATGRGGLPAHSLFPDQGPPGRLFRKAKFSGNRRALDILLDRGDLARLLPVDASLLLPVPPQRGRLLRRDLSVPDILTARLSEKGIPFSFRGLVRTGSDSQRGRSRESRRDAFFSPRFRVDLRKVSEWPRRGVVVVDDLLVTGWTARSLAWLLSEAGIEVTAIATLLFRPLSQEDLRRVRGS